MVLAATVVIASAIGAPHAARWLGIQSPPQIAGGEQPGPPEILSPVEAVTKARKPAPPRRRAAPSARPKPTTSARPPGVVRAPGEAVRQPEPSRQQLVSQAPAPVAAPPPEAPVATEPQRSIAAAAPVGRFFEPEDVDESPRVATRVEPRLSGDLTARPLNDTVVVRVLVSQTGHPSRVRLLRRSKVGRSLDDAVVAAVTQWTFSPARKEGEAVSCWCNIGVPLGQAN